MSLTSALQILPSLADKIIIEASAQQAYSWLLEGATLFKSDPCRYSFHSIALCDVNKEGKFLLKQLHYRSKSSADAATCHWGGHSGLPLVSSLAEGIRQF